jgi:DNA-directed RNA polymerase specialized sigma24 family protein
MMAAEPENDATAADQRPRDEEQAIHARTGDLVLGYLPQLTRFVMRELRIQESLGNLRPREVQPEEVIDAIVLEALERRHEHPAGATTLPSLRGIAQTVIQRVVADARERRQWIVEDEEGIDEILSPHSEVDEGAAGRPQPLLSEAAEETIDETLDEGAVEAEFRATVLRILNQMPHELVEPLLLHVRDQLPLPEVARIEGTSVREVDRRIAEAERILRERLQAEFGGLDDVRDVEALLEAVEEDTLTADELARLAERLREGNKRLITRGGANDHGSAAR